jgi:peptidoglycan/xylan/chitin deacetylase (PgdA/CDA1 family)
LPLIAYTSGLMKVSMFNKFRGDRIATIFLYLLLSRTGNFHKKTKTPILMYHSISKSDERHTHPYFRTSTSPETFAGHMKYLHDQGYKVITLEMLTGDSVQKEIKPVIITFDDGLKDFYTNAFPILQRYDFPATVFLTTGFIQRDVPFKNKQCLSWDDVRELGNYGTAFGSHTISHPQLHDLERDEIDRELRDSKKLIEEKIGKPVTSFSYPSAFPEEDIFFIDKLRNILEINGYASGVTTIIGRTGIGDDPLFLKRIPVNNCDDAPFFLAKLEGAYDWLHKPQYFYKFMKRRLRKSV